MTVSENRLGYAEARARLRARVRESAPSRIQLLSGPRQVGKTTLLLELAQELGERGLYAAADGPEAALPGWWERLWARAEAAAEARGTAVVLLDEVPRLEDWARRLKGEWDRLRRRRHRVHVVATGSSALHLLHGSRETLAGRFESLVLSHWSARALTDAFGLGEAEAVDMVVSQGAYPGAVALRKDASRWRSYIRDAIVEPAIGRDLLALHPIRRPALLRQVFAMAAGAPARIVSLQKLQGQLQDGGSLTTIAHYLELLEDAFLVAGLEKHSAGAQRRRAAPPKLVTLSNAILAALDPAGPPDRSADPERFGAWVENACLAHAWNAGQQVRYWREEPWEVDAVVEGSWGRWAIEVKTGAWVARDVSGLLEFTRRHPSYRPLVLSDEASLRSGERAGVAVKPWRQFLLNGPE